MDTIAWVCLGALGLVVVVGGWRLRAAVAAFADASLGDRRARFQTGLLRLKLARATLGLAMLVWILGLVHLMTSDASVNRMLLHLAELVALCFAGVWPFLKYRAHGMGRSLGAATLARLAAGQVVYQGITLALAAGLLYVAVRLAMRSDSLAFGIACLVAASLLNIALVFVLYPHLVRVLSGARPVTDQRTLQTLAELNRLCGTDVERLWLLPSPAGSLNAMVTGVSRRRPTVFVTDALLATLSTEDVRAVLAHELAHVRQRHILRSLGTSWMGFVLYMGLFFVLWEIVVKQTGTTPGPGSVAIMACVASVMIDVAVKLPRGRRRESEADELAASWVGSEALAGALERLYAANLAAADYSQTEKIWASHPTLRARLSQLNRT